MIFILNKIIINQNYLILTVLNDVSANILALIAAFRAN